MRDKEPLRTDRIRFYFRGEAWPLLVISVTGIFYNLGMVAGPWFEGQMVQYLCDILRLERRPAEMLALAAGYVLVIAFVQLMRYFKRLYVRKFANNISKSMKMTLFQNLMRQAPGAETEAGEMMTRLISDADACVEGMRKFTTEVFDTGVVMVAYFGMLFWYDWRLTLLVMLFPPAACLLAEKLKKVVARNVALSRESSARLNAATLDRIRNGLTYRVYGQERNQNLMYEDCLTDYEKKMVRANLWENTMQPVYQVISLAGTAVILWFGGKHVLGEGWTVWNVAAFTTYFACYRKLAVKSSKAAKLFNSVQKARVSWQRIQPYLRPGSEQKALTEPLGEVLEVREVAFSWPGQPPLFSHVTFTACRGQVVGVTGAVACGKSVLGRLLTGELPYEGRISMGKAVFSSKGEAWESRVSYLGHQPELMSGTVEENICLGGPGDVLPVLRAVCMAEEVAALPDGIHTVIGSGGVRLSGGQQARIALARTLYHKKPLIVLDDPFSAVDRETERQIFSNLRQYAPDSLILLISHRLTLFPQMERVLWMEAGGVLVSDHETLMRTEENYRALYTAQEQGADHEEN